MQIPPHPGRVKIFYKSYGEEKEHFMHEEIVNNPSDKTYMFFQGHMYIPIVKIVKTIRDGYSIKEEKYDINGHLLDVEELPHSNCPK